ncbi:MAG: hypothetical protein ABI621_01050 [Chloroflexota bacterium]
MNNRFKLSLAIASLALAALACQAVTGQPDAPATDATDAVTENTSSPANTAVPLPAETDEPTAESTVNSDVLLEDDFSSGRSQWGTGTDADSSVEYVDDALNIQMFTKNYFVWTTPNDVDYENIHMEVTVLNNATDSTTAFGFICDQQHPITESHYYFAVTPGGEYAIAKASLALDDVFLTNNDEWANSDLIAQDASSYRLGADCGNGTLTLYVDGQQVASISDSTYTSGGIALFTWSGQDAASANVTFDDFVMTELP